MLQFKIYNSESNNIADKNTISRLTSISDFFNIKRNDWNRIGSDIDGEADGKNSGHSVSLSSDGTVLAIGAPYNDGTTGLLNDNRGHVRVYKRTGSSWDLIGEIDGKAAGDNSGHSVSLSSDGTVLAIGATGNDGGHVRIYQYIGTTWTPRGEIDGESAGDNSGHSVSLSSDGTVLAIGATGNDGTGTNAGHVRIFKYDGTAWISRGEIDGEAAGDNSGYSVSLSSDGTILAIGAINHDGTGANAGHVRTYKYNGTTWISRGEIEGEAGGDKSGYSVSLSSEGTVLAIGARDNDGTGTNAGHVRIFKYDGTTWISRGEIDGEAAGDNSGWSVSLSSDGTVLAIGAIFNNGAGSIAGHVRIYKYIGTTWTSIGEIDGEAVNDISGHSVSLNSDGTVLAIGAINNDGTGTNAGHVRVYKYF
jgi:hypothetical protein